MLGSRELDPQGYYVPTHPSLTTPILLAGIPREIAICLGTFGAAVGLYITFWIVPMVLILWVLLSLWTAHDPEGIWIAKRFLGQAKHYHG